MTSDNPKSDSEHCSSHVDHDMGYAEWFEYCDRMAKKKIKQTQCPKCELWIWPDHWKVKK